MIKKTYYWKEITDDGLVKEPKEFGGHYEAESLNEYGGFASENEALKKLVEISETYEFDIPSSLILIVEYRVVK